MPVVGVPGDKGQSRSQQQGDAPERCRWIGTSDSFSTVEEQNPELISSQREGNCDGSFFAERRDRKQCSCDRVIPPASGKDIRERPQRRGGSEDIGMSESALCEPDRINRGKNGRDRGNVKSPGEDKRDAVDAKQRGRGDQADCCPRDRGGPYRRVSTTARGKWRGAAGGHWRASCWG